MARTANVGRLSISLDANTVRYINAIKKSQTQTEKRLDKMEKAFKRFKSSTNSSIGGVVAKLSALAGAYMSVGFAMQTFNTQRDLVDQLAKTADALGINIERLQALHHVGELNGVTVVQMNLSLQRMQRNLGDAAKGTGQAADTLHRLGLNIDEISEMQPDEQMDLFAKKLTSVARQTDKAKMAQDIFGRNGVRVLKVLEALKAEGIEPTADALEKMGVTLSREGAAKVESMNDSIFKAQEVLKGLANKIIVEYAPAIQALADKFTDWTKESDGFKEELKGLFEGLATSIKNVVVLVKALWNGMQIIYNGWEQILAGWKLVGEVVGITLAELVHELTYGWRGMIQTLENLWTSAINNIKSKAGEMLVEIGDKMAKLPEKFGGGFGESIAASGRAMMKKAESSLDQVNEKQKKLDAERLARAKVFEKGRQEAMDRYIEKQKEIADRTVQNQQDFMNAFAFGNAASIDGGGNDEGGNGGNGGDENQKEIEDTQNHYNTLLSLYADYDERLNKIRDESAISSVNRMMTDLEQFDNALGGKLKLVTAFAKAEAAVSAVMAGIQVWSDPTLSFYEKIPASIAAAAAVANLIGQFHGGVDEVPEHLNNKSFVLKAGERVVQPEANKKLTKFLNSAEEGGGGMGGNITIESKIEMGPSLVDEKVFGEALARQQKNIAALVKKEEHKRPGRVSTRNR